MLSNLTLSNDKITYRRIRKSIGYLGIFLPIILILFSYVPYFDTELQGSISQYYYTHLREILTGILCAVGLFLIRYEGTKNSNFWRNDGLLTNIAGVMAFGIALFPTSPKFCDQKEYTLFSSCDVIMGWLHYGFAMTFFIILAVISINVFTIGQEENKNLPIRLLNENHIYRWCGYLIFLFIFSIPMSIFLHLSPYSTLIFEALALFSFGISWLIKGRALGDRGNIGEILYREQH